jgi:DNA-binding CsgD family transcriptional regulator
MSAGPNALTEKEKEALRLLLEGHDAKSSAAELDLSVHTINDRLRNARRKLGVSSSREAARILGDTEGRPPQKRAPASFGVGPDDPHRDAADLTNGKRARGLRLTWLAGGMLAMSTIVLAAIIGLSFNAEEGPASTASAATQPTAEAQTAPARPASYGRATAFLAELDQSDWEGSWNVAGPLFRGEVSLSEWTDRVRPVRKPLGSVEDRKLVGVQQLGPEQGSAVQEMQVLQFLTTFEGRPKGTIETVFMARGEGGWEVTLYTVA